MTADGPGTHPAGDRGPADHPVPAAARRTRPGWVTGTAVILMARGLLSLPAAWAALGIVAFASKYGIAVFFWPLFLEIALVASLILSAVFVWFGRSWARVLATVCCVTDFVSGAIVLVNGGSGVVILSMLIDTVLVGMLRIDDVREWCRSRRR